MKKLVDRIIYVAVFLVIAFTGCEPKEVSIETNPRIKVKYDGGYTPCYQIIEVDGIEYLTQYGGGIMPLIKAESMEVDNSKDKNQQHGN